MMTELASKSNYAIILKILFLWVSFSDSFSLDWAWPCSRLKSKHFRTDTFSQMNPIRLHVSLVHSAEWIFSSWGPNMGTLCFSAVLIWRSGSNDSSPSPHQHRPTVFDASNQPTGGLATNHPWIHSHPAWRHISAMADATYRAPSALHFISFLTLPSPGKKKKNIFSILWANSVQRPLNLFMEKSLHAAS